MNFNCGVYTITSPSGKCYVGSSSNIKMRWSVHRSALLRGKHHCIQLQRACNKHGFETLKLETVAVCSKDDLVRKEQEQIDERGMANLYNSSPQAYGLSGYTISKEARAKQAAAMRGRKFSEETRRKMSVYAKSRTETHLAKLAAANIGKSASVETRLKQAALKRGKTQESAHIAKVVKTLLGIVRKDNVAGVRGVSPTSGGKWRARISLHGKYQHLGTFPSIEQAAEAVDSARRRIQEIDKTPQST